MSSDNRCRDRSFPAPVGQPAVVKHGRRGDAMPLLQLSPENYQTPWCKYRLSRYCIKRPLNLSRYTASFAFFEALWEYGVSHVFVNLGSDHPSIIEAIVKGQNEAKGQFPKIITCPNEVSSSHAANVTQ